MSAPSFIVAVPLLAILGVATVTDLRSRRIPNALSVGGAALGMLINAATFGLSGAVLALLGWLLCLACFLPLYASGGTAAGDVKLMATVGAFLGPINGFLACLLALLVGAGLGSLCMGWRRFVEPRLGEPEGLASSSRELDESAPSAKALDKIPYAAAIAVGATAAVLQPAWVTTLVAMGAN